jgi:7-carboxy-7-deazaguanine synthase
VLHHQVDGLLLRARQGPLLEDGAARAHEVEKPFGIDVPLQKRTVRRLAGDVALIEVFLVRVQKTSGIPARRSSRLPVKGRLRHGSILTRAPSLASEGLVLSERSLRRVEGLPRAAPSTIVKVLTINEIVHSIQGESTHSGRPCVFVRLSACDLRCAWCDTPYAFSEGTKRNVEEVARQVRQYGCGLVEITGGEPLLQRDVYPLMDRLLESGLTVMVETGGHLSIAEVPPRVIRIVDVKCPGSGESARNHWENLSLLAPHDEVKFVIRDRADYEFARDVVATHALAGRTAAVLFSPVHGVLAPKDLAGWILEDRLEVRLQLQAHKYIWGADVRGV